MSFVYQDPKSQKTCIDKEKNGVSFDTSMPNSSETSKLSANMKTIAEENLPLKKAAAKTDLFCSGKMYLNSVKATRAPNVLCPQYFSRFSSRFGVFLLYIWRSGLEMSLALRK